jgi:hypothetical protein
MAYDNGGVNALKPKPSGGRIRENLTLKEERAFLAQFAKAAGAGEHLNVQDLKAAYEKAIGHIGHPAHLGELLGVELTARGLDRLGQYNVWIAEELRLPFFTRDTGPNNAWPPWKPLLASTFVVPSGPPHWHEETKARNAARAEESQRVAALHEKGQRERQERERREAIAAIEQQVAERNRRAGWPY